MNKNLLNQKYLYKATIFIARIIPLKFLRLIGMFIALLNYIFCVKSKKNVKKNLLHVYNDRKKVEKIAKKIFLNYGKYIADWAKFSNLNSDNISNVFEFVKGKDIVERALKNQKGIILLTAHLGNWELGGLFFSYAGIPINVITEQDSASNIADIRSEYRSEHNVKTITIEKNSLFFMDIIKALDRNEIVAMLVERYKGNQTVKVDFFGSPANFPIGPVHIARITGATIIMAFTVSVNGKYEAVVDSMIDMQFTDDRKKDIMVHTKKIVNILEKYIIKYSDQWYNFEYLWKD